MGGREERLILRTATNVIFFCSFVLYYCDVNLRYKLPVYVSWILQIYTLCHCPKLHVTLKFLFVCFIERAYSRYLMWECLVGQCRY